MELSLPPLPVHLAGLRRAARACLRRHGQRSRRRRRPGPQRGDDQRHPVRVTPRQPVRVTVHVNDDLIQASVPGHGPDPPAQPPTDADTDALAAGGRVCGCSAPAGG